MTNPPAPEDVLPERIYLSLPGEAYYHTRTDARDTEYIRADLCTPAIADGVGVEEENRALRGTLEYILKQIDLNHPDILRVVRMNAKAALDRGLQKTIREQMKKFSTPPQAATDEG